MSPMHMRSPSSPMPPAKPFATQSDFLQAAEDAFAELRRIDAARDTLTRQRFLGFIELARKGNADLVDYIDREGLATILPATRRVLLARRYALEHLTWPW